MGNSFIMTCQFLFAKITFFYYINQISFERSDQTITFAKKSRRALAAIRANLLHNKKQMPSMSSVALSFIYYKRTLLYKV
jgi:hypothetical protein